MLYLRRIMLSLVSMWNDVIIGKINICLQNNFKRIIIRIKEEWILLKDENSNRIRILFFRF